MPRRADRDRRACDGARPAARYATARELAEDLRRFQTGQLVGAHRYSLRQLLARWLRRHRTALAALAAALVAGAAIGVFAVARIVAANQRVEAERALAVQHQANAEALMTFMLGDLTDKLEMRYRIDLLETVARQAATYYDTRSDALSDEDAYLSAIAHGLLARVATDHGDDAAMQAELAKQRALLAGLIITRPDVTKYRVALIAVEQALADRAIEHGDIAGGLAIAQANRSFLEHVIAAAPDNTDARHGLVQALRTIASIEERRGALDAAAADFRTIGDVVSVPQYRGHIADRDRMVIHADLGHLLGRTRGDYRAALPELRQSLFIGDALVKADASNLLALTDVAIDHRALSKALSHLGDLNGARVEAEASLAAAERLELIEPNENDETEVAGAHDALGQVLYDLHDFAGAAIHYAAQRAIDTKIATAHPDNLDAQRDLSRALNKVGDVRLAVNDANAALEPFRQAEAICERLVAADASNTEWRRGLFYSHNELAGAYRKIPGRAVEALAEMRRARDLAASEVERDPSRELALNDLTSIERAMAQQMMATHDVAGARFELHAALDIARRAAAGPNPRPEYGWREQVTALEHDLAEAGDPVKPAK